jgi:hypothetical protein
MRKLTAYVRETLFIVCYPIQRKTGASSMTLLVKKGLNEIQCQPRLTIPLHLR